MHRVPFSHLSAAHSSHLVTDAAAAADEEAPAPAGKVEAQLGRSSRARSIRLAILQRGRADFRQHESTAADAPPVMAPEDEDEDVVVVVAPPPPGLAEGDVDGNGAAGGSGDQVVAAGKPIYLVSDGTGWTLEHSVSAALRQFENYLADRSCAVNTHLFSGIQDTDRLMDLVKQAARVGALLLYTLSDPSMAESAKQACKLWGVPSADVLQPTTDAIAAHLGAPPSGIPRGAHVRKSLITAEYFRRIEAYDFSMKQDDGAQPQNLHRAHIVLVGVSRTGKTPLSIYLAQKGYKVANVPVVMDVDLPRSLFEISSDKIFGLTINCVVLQRIRKARTRDLGFDAGMSNYSDLDAVREELEYANKIFSQNPSWPVIDVTGKAIEETAAVVVRLYLERKQKCSTPRISRWY